MSDRRSDLEAKLKHLEFIQGVVTRLASASFQMKGWSVVLVSALLVLGVRAGSFETGLVSLFPIVVFWGLDGYFLSRERLFRKLYDHVRQRGPEKDVDFSMDVGPLMSKGRFWPRDWCSAMLSRTLLPFYGMLALLSVLTTVVVRRVAGGS